MENKKRIPLWSTLLIDLLCFLLLAGTLAGYFLLLPRTAVGEELNNTMPLKTFSLPVGEGEYKALEQLVLNQKSGDYHREILESYTDPEKQLVITKNEVGTENEKVTWYAVDVYVTDITVISTYVSVDDNGEIVNKSVLKQAEECDALLALTGDTFSMSQDGIIVRNGLLYRSDVRTANDICLLSMDGSMQVYRSKQLYTIADLEKKGAWQVFTFGPSLLDENGEPKEEFNIAASHLSDLSFEHPRTAMGMVEPGHFVFVLVDGRDEGYSRGATFPELAKIMKNEGCSVAYNLDGGRSAVMTYEGKWVNQPYKNGRGISDIIYLAKYKKGEDK